MSEEAMDFQNKGMKRKKRSYIQTLKKNIKCVKGADLDSDLREYFIRVLIRGDKEFDSIEEKSKYVLSK